MMRTRISRLLPYGATFTLLCLAVAASVAFVAGGRTQTAAAGAQRKEPKEVLAGEVVTITPRGFEPGEMTRSHGRFFLVVENRSGRRALTLVLESGRGNRLREFTQPEDELDWVVELHLAPGRYTLSPSEHPGWACRITVTPH